VDRHHRNTLGSPLRTFRGSVDQVMPFSLFIARPAARPRFWVLASIPAMDNETTGIAHTTDPAPGPSRHGEACASCTAPVATRHAAPGGAVWLCPSCAVQADLGCP